MNKKNAILFLVAGEQQMEAMKYAKSDGYFVHSLDNNPSNPGHRIAHESHIVDVYDEAAVGELAGRIRPAAIINFVSSHGIESGIKAGRRLGLRTVNLDAFRRVTCKRTFRSFLEESGYDSPAVVDESVLKDFSRYPDGLIAKPILGGGSKGIMRLSSVNEAVAFFASPEWSSGSYIVEEFLRADFALNGDCIVADNKIIYLVVGDYVYDHRDSVLAVATAFPTVYHQEQVRALVQRLVIDLDYGTGALNFEIIVSNDRCFFIEVNPRHSGNYIHEIISIEHGVRAAIETVRLHLGEPSKNPTSFGRGQKKHQRFLATALVFSARNGAFSGLTILPSLRPCLRELKLFKAPGDPVNEVKSLYDRVALMILEFNSRIEMMHVLSGLKYHYDLRVV